MKIVFMGTPEFAVPILEKLNELYEIKLVISQPNRVKKKNVFIDTPVAKIAKELNLNLIQPENIKDEYEYIKNIDADLLISAAYGQYVPTKILNLFKKCINVHASILPKHRGGAPIQRCLIEGDKLTGVTIMEMTKKLDAGKIYAIKEYEIKDDGKQGIITVTLKYGQGKTRIIQGLRRVSKPGLKIYCSCDDIPKVKNGLGIAIISTSKGIMTDKKARAEHVGGEVLAFVW